MHARTKHARLVRIEWSLEPADVTEAIRRFILASPLRFGKDASHRIDVEINEDGGALASWTDETHDGTHDGLPPASPTSAPEGEAAR